jgi:hypothetical protein
MHKRFLLGLVLFAAGAFLPLRAQTPAASPAPSAPAAMPPGQILAAKVTGVVTMTVNAAPAVTLVGGEPIPQHATINTNAAANAVLVFSNGATTQLGENSQLVIDEFLQDPFPANITMANIDTEPTTSKTKLRLNHGELVGNVKHLQHTKGSTFTVDTPVGAAGIRGTTFRIVFRPNGTGLAFFSLSTVEGNVAFQQPGAPGSGPGNGNGTPANGAPDPNAPATGTGAGTGTPAGTPTTGGGTGTSTGGSGGLAVTGGQEVVITINVTTNPTTGAVTISTPVVVTNTTNISAATLQAVTQQAVAAVTATATVTFTAPPPPPPPTPTPTTGSNSTPTTTGDTNSTNSGTPTTNSGTTPTTNPNPTPTSNTNTPPSSSLGSAPPPPTSSAPHLTSGDGKSE